MPKVPDVGRKRVPRSVVVFLELWYFLISTEYGFFQWIGVGRIIFAGDTKVYVIISWRRLRARAMPCWACEILRHILVTRMPWIYEHAAVHQYVQLHTVPMHELWGKLFEELGYVPVGDMMSVHELQSLQKKAIENKTLNQETS